MAASMTRAVTLTSCCRRYFAANVCKQSSASQTFYRTSSTSTENQETTVENIVAENEAIEEENRIEQLRDISGLSERQRRKLHGLPLEMVADHHKSVRWHRKQYGRLGSASGIDPRLSWPPRQKALELAQLFREWEPPLEERMEKLRLQKEETAREIKEREEMIAKNMEKMDQWVSEYKNRLQKKELEAQKKEEKKRKLLEEAREYFGYYVDPRDEKFKEMLEEKEKQEKLLAKKQKKEKRLEKLAERLQLMAMESSSEKTDLTSAKKENSPSIKKTEPDDKTKTPS